ncbi:FG-GAP-like repeat-containing protein [Hymenobacter daeguensis]
MKHLSATTNKLLSLARRGALLLALGAAGPVAWGQGFSPMVAYPTGPSAVNPEGLAVSDLNGDGRVDIVTANAGSATVSVLMGLAGGGFGTATTYSAGGAGVPFDVAIGDVSGDGRPDIVVPNSGQGAIGVLLGRASGGFAPATTYALGINLVPTSVALGDVTGDGRLDIVAVINGNAAGICVLAGQASGGFAAPNIYSTGAFSYPSSVELGDVNGDGRLDAAINIQGFNTVGILLGQAGGGLGTLSTYPIGFSNVTILGLAIGDVNGDGRPDIVTGLHSINLIGVLLGQAGGGFAPPLTYNSNSRGPIIETIADVNSDGRLDIVEANFFGDNVGVLLSQANQPSLFASAQSYATGLNSMPSGVVASDVNNDGRVDIVVANAGTNTVGVLLNTGNFTLATAPTAAAEVALYPNPAQDAFTVQLPAGLVPTQAELLDALGQVVRRPAIGSGSFQVETSGLAPGLYTLRLRAGGTALAKRVVVE